MPVIFVLKTPITCFPSDNFLDSLPRRERIAIKKTIKQEAQILTLSWLVRNKIKPNSISKQNPLLTKKAKSVLRIYLKKGTTLDPSNLSIKSFLDQVVKMGIIKDDSEKFLPESLSTFVGYVNGKSYAEFEIREIEVLEVF